MKLLKLMALIAAVSSTTAFAKQIKDCDKSHRWWMNLGAGVGTVDNGSAAAQFSFNGMLTDHLFLNLSSTASGTGESNGDKEMHDTALMLGYRGQHPKWFWAASTGISHYEYREYYSYYSLYYSNWGSTKTTGVGLPVQGQLFWTPSKHFGLGLIGHSVLISKSYGALMFGIQVS